MQRRFPQLLALGGLLLAGVTDAAEVELLTARVRVTSSDGAPIAGAKVTPWARRASNGHGIWGKEDYGDQGPPTVLTDKEGQALVPYPRFAFPGLKLEPTALTCRVEHADYADSVYNNVPVPQFKGVSEPITLSRGAQVVFCALDQDSAPVSDGVHVMWSDHSYWACRRQVAAEGNRFTLPRLTAGLELFRLVRVQAGVATHFSNVVPGLLDNGEPLELTEKLRPAVAVNGVLSDNVPRPVSNGRVVAVVVNKSGEGFESLYWNTWARVDPDGSFVLEGLPPMETLQLIALCDGFRAATGAAPDFAEPRERERAHLPRAQVFDLPFEGTEEVLLEMEPTCECEFRVTDQDGKPIEGIEVQAWPNIFWWNGGSQIYGSPLARTVRGLQDPEADLWAKDEGEALFGRLYSGVTDAQGRAVLEDLPAGKNSYLVTEGRNKVHRFHQAEGKVEVSAERRAEESVELKRIK